MKKLAYLLFFLWKAHTLEKMCPSFQLRQNMKLDRCKLLNDICYTWFSAEFHWINVVLFYGESKS